MSRSLLSYVAGAFVFTMCVFACAKPAMAVTEFCPARLAQMHDPASTPEELAFPTKDVVTATAGTRFTYTLDAQTPRSILGARMIADTDAGWYGWHVENIPLAKTSVAMKSGPIRGSFMFARSAPLSVTFPTALVVHHAWVVMARSSGETLLGWDALGDYGCEVPDYDDGGPGYKVVARRQASVAPAATLSAAAADGVAVEVPPPFPIDCDRPFKRAIVTRPMTPEYPRSAMDAGVSLYVSLVEVAVGDDGRLIDAWMHASSGNNAVDLSALRAARLSTYSNAVSYCQRVRGYYVFRADFMP